MLPEGFRWAARWQYDTQETALYLGVTQVAILLERVDGSWFARLNCHRPIKEPVTRRDCTSLEAGRAGIEAWACRHEPRLRRETGST